MSAPAPRSDRPPIQLTGRWRVHAPLSAGVVGLYVLVILVLLLLGRPSGATLVPGPLWAIAALLVLFLARYASVTYSMDSVALSARRLFGSRTVPLEEIRRIELANLRDLAPASFFGGWGWRGRTWSPRIGAFDAIHTVSPGILVYSGEHPLFLSPPDPVAFARELSRRARSYFEGVEVGPGIPGPPGSVPARSPAQ